MARGLSKFRASFSTTGNTDHDVELRQMEQLVHRVEDIMDTCAKYDVSARIFGESGRVLGEVERGGYRTNSRSSR